MKVTAIETRYNGYRFRSRLEARWAVFFDTLGIPYEYETEGFDLGHGGWYLPDFWLPDCEVWIEVKPKKPTLDETTRAAVLCAGKGDCVDLVVGVPKPDTHVLHFFPFASPAGHSEYFTLAVITSYWLPQVFALEAERLRTVSLASISAKSARFEHGRR